MYIIGQQSIIYFLIYCMAVLHTPTDKRNGRMQYALCLQIFTLKQKKSGIKPDFHYYI